MNELQRAFRRVMTTQSNRGARRFYGGAYVVEHGRHRYVVATDGRRLTAVRTPRDVSVGLGVYDPRTTVRSFLKKNGTLGDAVAVKGIGGYGWNQPLPVGWDTKVFEPPEPSWVVDVDAHELRRWVAGPILKGVLVEKDTPLRFEWDNGLVIRAEARNVGEAAVEIPATLVDAGTRLDAVDVPTSHVADALRWHPKATTVRIAMPATQEKAIRFTVGTGVYAGDITLVAKQVWTVDAPTKPPAYAMGRP